MSYRLRQHASTALVVVVALVAALLVAVPGAASADTAPSDLSLPTTASADVLPTPQINGVVWTQAVVGNRVYVGGDFTTARPFGDAPGTNEVPRTYLLAYDIRSGVLIDSFAPVLNAPVLSLAVSPDGRTVYAGGTFTMIEGKPRTRIAAFDAATGTLNQDFKPVLGASVRAIAVSPTTVYAGGDFAAASGRTGLPTEARAHLAAFDAADGTLAPWAPSTDQNVRALALNQDRSLVVVGGHFAKVNGEDWYGMAALDPASGATRPWAAKNSIKNYGPNAAITSLTSDANGILVTAYTFNGGGGNFEAAARLDGKTGKVTWIIDCRGDHHSAFAQAGVVYTVGHPHRCSNVPGGFEERWPRVSPGGGAYTDEARGELNTDVHGWVERAGEPAPQTLHFWPNWYFGTYTTSDQGAWHVTGNDQYLVYGGEFIGLNGITQQGLTRMARVGVEGNPNAVRPVSPAEFTPTVVSYAPGQAHVGWQTTYDHDNERLTYRVYRDYVNLQESTPVHEVVADSSWASRRSLSFIDRGLQPGATHDYLIVATDPDGNRRASGRAKVTIAATTDQEYGNAVLGDLPTHYIRFSDGPDIISDTAAGAAAASQGVSLGAGSPLLRDSGDKVGKFSGAASYTATQIQSPAPNDFTIEAWFQSTDGSGGRIAGYSTHYKDESGQEGSDWTDRHLYLDTDGRIRFGVDDRSSSKVTLASSTGYDDGKWHHVAASLSGDGMVLYVDGEKVGQNPSVTEGRRMTGSWRIGTDSLSGWPKGAASGQFVGSIDEVAVYPRALTASEVRDHVAASGSQVGGGGGGANLVPVASFTPSVQDRTVSFDATGSYDPDGSIKDYRWDFGDGTTGTGSSPKHTYASYGSFTATLTVVDDDGASAKSSQQVKLVRPPNVDPEASFTVSTAQAVASFDASASQDADGTIASYRWDFGDGAAGSGPTAQHAYTKPGSYTVRLTVTDDRNGTATTSRSVTIGGGAFLGDFAPVEPARLADTRVAGGILPAGQVLRVKVAGSNGVESDATAASLNVTVTGPRGAGWLRVYPCGGTTPATSNLNFTAGLTIPNAVLTGIGTGGEVCIAGSTDTHVVVDLMGWFPKSSSFTPITPARLADTRVAGGILPAGQVQRVKVAGTSGVPADASAASLNVTVTGPARTGWLRVYPCGGNTPATSNLNFTAGQTIPNAVLTGIGTGGEVCVSGSADTHVVVDLMGWYE